MTTETIDTLADVAELSDAEVDAALAEPLTSPDPEAPYGRKADGSPKRRPGRPRKETTATPSPVVTMAPPKSTRARRSSASSGRKASAATGDAAQYTKAVGELLTVPVALLAGLGSARDDQALIADAATISTHAPALAAAVGELAEQTPGLAAVLDRLTAASPYAAIVTVVLAMGAQLAANHGAIRPGLLGSQAPEAVTAEWIMRNQAAAAAEAAA